MKIIFTSCSRVEDFPEQSHWNLISDQNPDYLFLLGDTIYMDYGIPPFSREPVGRPKKYTAEKFEKVMNAKYRTQFTEVPAFKNLVDQMRAKKGFYAIWDDHDFAWDNAKGTTLSADKMEITRRLFHEYLDCSTNLPHVYYHIDTPLARVIFIDNRTDAEESGENSKIISEAQFTFIEDSLNHDLQYTLLCGGNTLTEGSENWTKYPSQLKRLCQLLEGRKNTIFIAGDIHQNKFVEPQQIEELNVTTPVQLISSGMNINYFGLGHPIDDKHNWAMLELLDNAVIMSYFTKRGMQNRRSMKATTFLNSYLTF